MKDPARAALLAAIVGFELPMTRVVTKLSMSQNRAPEDRAGVMRALAASPRRVRGEAPFRGRALHWLPVIVRA